MKIRLYRRRFIPDETVFLKDDEILLYNDEVIVTRWTALKPRDDFARGLSCYFLNKGMKVSKFFDSNGGLVYYYCDIIETVFNAGKNSYCFNDLLIDVIVYKDGSVRVCDLGEVPDRRGAARAEGLIGSLDTKSIEGRVPMVYVGVSWQYLPAASEMEPGR